jgi:hypothetical protein
MVARRDAHCKSRCSVSRTDEDRVLLGGALVGEALGLLVTKGPLQPLPQALACTAFPGNYIRMLSSSGAFSNSHACRGLTRSGLCRVAYPQNGPQHRSRQGSRGAVTAQFASPMRHRGWPGRMVSHPRTVPDPCCRWRRNVIRGRSFMSLIVEAPVQKSCGASWTHEVHSAELTPWRRRSCGSS